MRGRGRERGVLDGVIQVALAACLCAQESHAGGAMSTSGVRCAKKRARQIGGHHRNLLAEAIPPAVGAPRATFVANDAIMVRARRAGPTAAGPAAAGTRMRSKDKNG